MTAKPVTLDNAALEAIVAERVDAALTEERNKNAAVLKKRVEMVEAKAKAQFDVLKEELISDTEAFLMEASKGGDKPMANIDEIQKRINEMKRRDRERMVEGRYGRMERARRMRRPVVGDRPVSERRAMEGRRMPGRYASEGRYMGVDRKRRFESEDRPARFRRPRFESQRQERPVFRESALDRPLRRRPSLLEHEEQRPVRRMTLRERLERRRALRNENRDRRPLRRDRDKSSVTEGRRRPSLMEKIDRSKKAAPKEAPKTEGISPEKRKAFLMAGVARYTQGLTDEIKQSVTERVESGKITSLVAMRKFIKESVEQKAAPKTEEKVDDKKPMTESTVTEGAEFAPPVEEKPVVYPVPDAW